MPSKLYVFLFHLMSRAGCEIRLYRFLIVAFSSTFQLNKPETNDTIFLIQINCQENSPDIRFVFDLAITNNEYPEHC